MDGNRWENFRERLGNLEASQLVVPFIIILVLIGTIVGIVNYSRRRALQEPPKIEVISPSEGLTTEEEKLVVSGKTNPGSTVSVNDRTASVDEEGGFSAEVNLVAGENTINVVATNEAGKSTDSRLLVTKIEKPIPVAGSDGSIQGSDLSRSGPETLWIPEISALSLAAASWYGSRKKLSQNIQKSFK